MKCAAVRSFFAPAVSSEPAEMRARYLGPNADLMKVRGSRHDTGEVLMMALGWARRRLATGRARTRRPSTRPFRTWRSAARRIVTAIRMESPLIRSASAFSTRARRAIRTRTRRPVGRCSVNQELWRIRSMIRRRFRCSVPGMSFPRRSKPTRSMSWRRKSSSPRCCITRSENSTTPRAGYSVRCDKAGRQMHRRHRAEEI